jgi:hypothetical protein
MQTPRLDDIRSLPSIPLTEPASYTGQISQTLAFLDVVAWPEEAASWLRPAGRFASGEPDLWVMTGAAPGWAQMTRRLLWSTPWQPRRTLALGDHLARAAGTLVGIHNVEGLTGTTATGTWAIRDGHLTFGETS